MYARPWGFRLQDITVPVYLWHGGADINVPISVGRYVAESIPDCTERFAETGLPLVREVTLFDLYRGEQAGAGRKSLAYALTYQADDRTLTDNEVAKVRGRIVKRLEKELGAQLRA